MSKKVTMLLTLLLLLASATSNNPEYKSYSNHSTLPAQDIDPPPRPRP